jgi:hypothetical protein
LELSEVTGKRPNNGMVGDPKSGTFSCVSSCVGE